MPFFDTFNCIYIIQFHFPSPWVLGNFIYKYKPDISFTSRAKGFIMLFSHILSCVLVYNNRTHLRTSVRSRHYWLLVVFSDTSLNCCLKNASSFFFLYFTVKLKDWLLVLDRTLLKMALNKEMTDWNIVCLSWCDVTMTNSFSYISSFCNDTILCCWKTMQYRKYCKYANASNFSSTIEYNMAKCVWIYWLCS